MVPFLALFIVLPLLVVHLGKQRVYVSLSSVPHYGTAIVFGAGIRADGTPSAILADRLTIAANLYRQGAVETILISGDGDAGDTSETLTMQRFLEQTKGIPHHRIVRDTAGARTYDTCQRAVRVWGVQRAILVSQGYHLHRALFTCRMLGMDAAGIASNLQQYRNMSAFKLREIFAIYRTLIDLAILQPLGIL